MMKNPASLLFVLVIGLSACTPPATLAPTPTAPVETIAAPSPTSTPLPPAIIINKEMGCLSTPQEGGQLVATFHTGDTVLVVGKDDYGKYWVVIDPASGTGCWISREGTSVQGIVDYLPNLVPPPTPFPHKPAAPGNLKAVLESWQRAPNSANKEWIPVVVLTWEDKSDNEDSFSIYKFGNWIGHVGCDETRYRDGFTIQSDGKGAVTYAISSYSNSNGESDLVEITLDFQCGEG
ncbi:MAG TPA: hypothetical protein VIV15_16045 [Anaerolineales bacterium]